MPDYNYSIFRLYFVLTYLIDFTGKGEAEVMDNSRCDLRVSFPAANGVEVTTQNTTLFVRLYLDKVVSQSNKCAHRKKRTSLK